MKEIEDARELAEAMVDIGRAMGKGVVALITAMDQPLGRTVGKWGGSGRVHRVSARGGTD